RRKGHWAECGRCGCGWDWNDGIQPNANRPTTESAKDRGESTRATGAGKTVPSARAETPAGAGANARAAASYAYGGRWSGSHAASGTIGRLGRERGRVNMIWRRLRSNEMKGYFSLAPPVAERQR